MQKPFIEIFIRTVLTERKKKKFSRVPLSFKKTDLSPVKSKETLDYHYGKLYKGYVDKANDGVGGKFQVAGAFLHGIYFSQLKPPSGSNRPKGPFLDLIETKHGSYEKFQEAFKEVAMRIQGSGWVYVDSKGAIKTIVNHEIKPDIVFLVDWWEHAWALDYQSDKEKYLDNTWKMIDWDKIDARIVTEED